MYLNNNIKQQFSLFLYIFKKFAKFRHVLRNDVTEGSTQGAHTCASCVLPRKVGKMVWIFGEVNFEGNDVCFLGASYYELLIAPK